MKKNISILAIMLALSIVQANAKLSTMIKKVEGSYNFWLY